MEQDVISLHTSDRILYKRCRRKWDLRSSLRRHLVPDPPQEILPLWFGTGIHFVLEDYFGYNKFGDPVLALEAFYNAFDWEELPAGADEELALGLRMLDYFVPWYERRNASEGWKTLFIDGVPQVEVDFRLELTELSEIAGKPVLYEGTFDRIVQDCYGRYWIMEFKTAKSIDLDKLVTDPQVKAYVWAAEQWYNAQFEGVLYMQMAKDAPSPPRILKNGTISVDKNQKTTHQLLRATLLQHYPDGNFPGKYVEFLNTLAEQETPEGNRFVRIDTIHVNDDAKANTYKHIIAEGREMIDPDLPIYPNPTRDCAWDCKEMRSVCIAMDEDSDWEYMLDEFFKPKGEERHEWRKKVRWPQSQPMQSQ